MDRIDLNVRTQQKCKFFSKSMTNNRFYGKIKARKQLVLIVEEIRT